MVLFVYRDEYYYRTEEDWLKEHPNEEYPAGWRMLLLPNTATAPTGEVKLRFDSTLAKFENMATEPTAPAPGPNLI